MRLATRLAVSVIALTLAACGGDDLVVQEVPGEPVELTVPGTGDGLTSRATPTPTPDADADAEATATVAPAAEATAAPQDTGTAETPTQPEPQATAAPDGSGGNQAPDPGSAPEQFEEYCANNPGAC